MAGASVAGDAGLVLWRALDSPTAGNTGVVSLAGSLSVLLLAVAVSQPQPPLLVWALGGLAVTYGLGLPVHAGSLAEAAGYGIGLFAIAEAAYWSLELTTPVGGAPATRRPRWLLIAAVALVAALADDLAFGAAYFSSGGGLLLTAAVAATVLLVGVVAALVHLGRTDEPPPR